MKLIRTSWSPAGKPAPADEVRRAISERKGLVATCRKNFPNVAMRLFPKPAPTKLVNMVTTKQRAAFLYIHLGKKGSCAFAVSGSRGSCSSARCSR